MVNCYSNVTVCTALMNEMTNENSFVDYILQAWRHQYGHCTHGHSTFDRSVATTGFVHSTFCIIVVYTNLNICSICIVIKLIKSLSDERYSSSESLACAPHCHQKNQTILLSFADASYASIVNKDSLLVFV